VTSVRAWVGLRHNDGVMGLSSMTMRAGATVLGGVLAVGVLAGCGGADDSGDKEPSDVESSSTEPTEPSEGTSDPAAQGYLPVPEDVTLTEPGTALGLGDAATIAWRPRQDTVVALDVTVDRIDKTSFKESFEGWVVTRAMKAQTPYFVRTTVTNVSDTEVSRLLVPLYALAGGTNLYEPLSFTEEPFEPCPGGQLPERLRPGKSADLCFVYLMPQGQQLMAAAFDPVGELAPITWTGKITSIDDGKKKDKKKDKKRG
jgi:hypothetical protein